MVPRSPEDVTCAMRGQPKRLSGNGCEMWWKVIYMFVLQKTFHSTDYFSTLSRLFVRLAFPVCFLLVWLFILCRSFDFRDFNHDDNGYNGCVRMRCNSSLISLTFFTKQQREIATFCVEWSLRLTVSFTLAERKKFFLGCPQLLKEIFSFSWNVVTFYILVCRILLMMS